MAPPKLNLRSKLDDHELDLSLNELTDVPVKDIAALPKATALDLSNNQLSTLGATFAPLLSNQLVKLDLSKNILRELPENFGELRSLRHLDLYNNQIERLPLSFGKLAALRWLDLKSNPLVAPLREKAGDCLDAAQCQKCAREVVQFMQVMQVSYDQRREEILREYSETAPAPVSPGKGGNQAPPAKQKAKQRKSKKKKSGNSEDSKQNGSAAENNAAEQIPDPWEAPVTRSYAYTTGKGSKKGAGAAKKAPPNSLHLATTPPQTRRAAPQQCCVWPRAILKAAIFAAILVVAAAILEPTFHSDVAVRIKSWSSSVLPPSVAGCVGNAWDWLGSVARSEYVEGATRVVRSGVSSGVESVLGHRPLLRDGIKRLVEGTGECLTSLRQWVLGW